MVVDLPSGWMRQIIDASGFRRPMQPIGCIGHFFDNERKLKVVASLGAVSVRCFSSFRAAPSDSECMRLDALSWLMEELEGAAPSDELPEHAVRFFESGSYVIPGLTLPEESITC